MCLQDSRFLTSAKMGVTKDCLCNSGSHKVRPAEVRPAEVRIAEVRIAEVRPAEVSSTEVRPAEDCGPDNYEFIVAEVARLQAERQREESPE
jgi:hypothetical protein